MPSHWAPAFHKTQRRDSSVDRLLRGAELRALCVCSADMSFLSFSLFPSAMSFIICLGLAAFVGARGFRQAANLGFTLALVGLGIKEAGGMMMETAASPSRLLFWGQAFLLGQALMGGGWMLFSMTFARVNASEILKKKWPLLLGYAVLFLGLLWFPLFAGKPTAVPPSSLVFVTRLGYLFVLAYLLSMVSALMNLEQTYRASSGIPRFQIKYMVLGVGAILALEVYRAGQVLLFSSIDLKILPYYSSALIFAYGLILFTIVRHRLLNVDVFVSRYVVYKSVTLLAVGCYLAVVGLMVLGVQRFGGEHYVQLIPIFVFAALLGMVILLLSEGLRRQMQTFINVHFYRNKYDYRIKWQEFTGSVGNQLNLPELLPSLVAWLAESIGTNDAAVWLLDRERNRYYLSSRRSFASVPTIWSGEGPLVEAIRDRASPLVLTPKNDLFESIRQESPEFFASNTDTAWIPMLSNQDMVGILALGKKITKDRYDYHDLELLMTISDQAAGQIDRVRLIEELTVVRELKAIHTLSSFFLHDLKNYTSTLSLLAQNVRKHGENPEFQKDAFRTIEVTVDKMNQLIQHITVVAKGLVLNRSMLDINQLIEDTLSGLNGALGLKGRIYSILGDLPLILADSEQLANVLRNLIINACNAINGQGNVDIETRSDDQRIYISVRDNGCGMSEEFIATKLFKPLRTTKAAGWGIGLFQCQQIVKGHGGRIGVESQEGGGSTFTVELPLVSKT